MEYRTQTILGTLQGVTVLAGTLLVGAIVHGSDSMLVSDAGYDPLVVPRRIGNWGYLLFPLPVLWTLFTIHAERVGGESKGSTLVSGLAILVGLISLFGWAGLTAATIPFR
jgi:hypothetical protein